MSEEKAKPIYAGNGKIVTTKSGFTFLSFNLSPEDISKINTRASDNQGWCKINIMSRKEPSAKGTTHYGSIDIWKPQPKLVDDVSFDATEGIPF